MNDHDLHWLGGVWDGEGNFSLVAVRGTHVSVQTRFTNTEEVMINEVRRILDAHAIPYHLKAHPPTRGKRPVWHLSINGMLRSLRFLLLLRPYLRAKAKDADLVLRFIALRQSRPVNAPYEPEEIECFVQLRDLHGYTLRESSETLRSAMLAHSAQRKIKSDPLRDQGKMPEPKGASPATSAE